MASVAERSSRSVYLFVALNLLLLLVFVVTGQSTLRGVQLTRDDYGQIVRSWLELRVAIAASPHGAEVPPMTGDFNNELEAFVASPRLEGARRISDPLTAATGNVRDAWERLRMALEQPPRGNGPGAGEVLQATLAFHDRLLGLEGGLEEFVGRQQRALEILLIFLGATIVATIAILFAFERENQVQHAVAVDAQSLAQSTIFAQERERERISRELHDSLAQELSVAILELDEVRATGNAGAASRLRSRLQSSVRWVRSVAHALHPAEIEQIGLAAALVGYCRELADTVHARIECNVTDEACAMGLTVAIGVYRIAQEALTNAIRHGQPQRIVVRLFRLADRVVLRVEDDGSGFRTGPDALRAGRGIGLAGMRERANMMDGSLTVTSRRGSGTIVELTVPASMAGCEDAT